MPDQPCDASESQVRAGISVLATKTCWDTWLNPVCAWTASDMYHVHTLHIHVHTVYMHVHTLYIGTPNYLRVPLACMLPVCTALVMCMYYAIVQEYDFLYVLHSDRYIPP